MDTYKSGMRYQKMAIDACLNNGHTIWFKSQRVIFGKVDFGPAPGAKVDIISVDRVCTMHAISVKSQARPRSHKRHIEALKAHWYRLPHICVQLWVYTKPRRVRGKWDLGGWQIIPVQDGGHYGNI